MKKIIIVVVIIFLVILGLFYIFVFNQSKEDKTQEEYLKYENTKYNFSIEYPKAWYSSGMEEDSSVIFFRDTKEESGDGGVPLGVTMDIIILENEEGLGLEEWIDQSLLQGPAQEVLEEGTLNFGDIRFFKKTFAPFAEFEEIDSTEAGSVIVAYTTLDNEKYIVQISYLGREPNYTTKIKHFEHLLKSFKIQKPN